MGYKLFHNHVLSVAYVCVQKHTRELHISVIISACVAQQNIIIIDVIKEVCELGVIHISRHVTNGSSRLCAGNFDNWPSVLTIISTSVSPWKLIVAATD